jgi:hypothetical protein
MSMANGYAASGITDLVARAAYQRELAALMQSLTEEGPDGAVRAAKSDAQAWDAIIAFRRAHVMPLLTDEQAADAARKMKPGEVVDPRLVYLVGLHRAIIRHPAFVRAAEKIPPDADAMKARGVINYSEHWLIRQGFGCDVDTQFNPKPQNPTPAPPHKGEGRRKPMPWEKP